MEERRLTGDQGEVQEGRGRGFWSCGMDWSNGQADTAQDLASLARAGRQLGMGLPVDGRGGTKRRENATASRRRRLPACSYTRQQQQQHRSCFSLSLTLTLTLTVVVSSDKKLVPSPRLAMGWDLRLSYLSGRPN
jgi:hypothetical protein